MSVFLGGAVLFGARILTIAMQQANFPDVPQIGRPPDRLPPK
jgi:hypothetical protein